MKHVEKAIFEKIKDVIPNKVFAFRAPQKTAAPFIVFQKTDSDRWRSINGQTGVAQAYIQIDVYHTGFYDGKEIAGQIETILDGFRGDVQTGADTVTILGISLQNDVDLLDDTDDPKLYRNSATYLVTYNQ